MRRASVAARKQLAGTPHAPDPAALLAWYDRHRRKLPWRAAQGARTDPYRVWLSEIMLQQTTVKVVAPYYEKFLARWPNVQRLARAPLADVLSAWAGLGYYARARNLHACAKTVVERFGETFPATEEELRTLSGIGPYTAAAIAAIAFDRRAVAVDGNVERVVTRLFAIEDELPAAKLKIKTFAETLLPENRYGDFTQGLMDLGATICTPKKPACALCPWNDACLARARGDQQTFPRKSLKIEGKLRRGAAFVVTREDGALLLRTRAPKGLLGGMTEVPTSDWTHQFDEKFARKSAPRLVSNMSWRRLPGVVTHTFTHFPLELAVFKSSVGRKIAAPAGTRWTPLQNLANEALPNVMRKVIAHALGDHGLPKEPQ